ncbi:L,D-transpeptidase family protein [Capnocytophaga granulosa]|uniref:L,D-transpeptidase family protein n=1 Tax=Capnocytophaga granulosa TaxID=45242 RepID=UPI003C743421
MLKHICLLSVVILFAACRDKGKNGDLLDEMVGREINEPYEPLFLQDTAVASLKKVTIKDNYYKPAIEREVVNFYKKYNYQTRWLYQNKPSPLFASYIKTLTELTDYGFFPQNYRQHELDSLVGHLYQHKDSLFLKQLEMTDREITASFLLLTRHLTQGRIPKVGDGVRVWKRNKPIFDNVELLLKLKDTDNLSTIIGTLQPQQAFYKAMAQKYKELLKDTTSYIPFAIADPKSFAVGYSDSTVVALRNQLGLRGYKPVAQGVPAEVDSLLIEAVKQFQRQVGLTADGVPGAQTMSYLQMTPQQQSDLLLLNMERLRWQNKDLGEDYILVNIPEYRLRLFHKDSLKFTTNVVVGRPDTPTPIFSDSIKFVEFRPTWSVPISIVRKEMIPHIVNSGDSLKYAKRGYKLYENNKEIDPTTINWKDEGTLKRNLAFVESPSAYNSLGLVKFILYNNMSIYLHDTPSKKLFDNTQRTYSHGCVRVQYPDSLAYQLLKHTAEWNYQKVNDAMQTGRNQYRVRPKQHFVVDISYLTAWVDEAGQLIIRNDPYQFDKEQLKFLERYKKM